MAHATSTQRTRQVRSLAEQLDRAPGLPFADLLSAQQVEQALQHEGVSFRDRLFSPLVTLWVFLSQCLDPDHGCRAAVARFLAWRAARGRAPGSADPSAYCKARQRLPEGVLSRLTRDCGRRLQDQAPDTWRWHGRHVKLVDGTTVSMPDTPANQQAYPQPRTQQAGTGFPMARLVVIFSLAVGTVLDIALGRCHGKQTGETALFHGLRDRLQAGDIVLADRYYGSYWELAFARQGGWDMVCRLHQRRQPDFRRGRRLGKEDHVVRWHKPKRPDWMDETTYAGLPDELEVREVRVHVRQAGFRTRVLVVATTLLDAETFPAADVAILYRLRWYAELDLRALKQTMQMDVLRCESPAMVRKEVWAHLLAYNLVRGLLAQTAQAQGLFPWQLSFKGAVQAVQAFAAVLWTATVEALTTLCQQLRAVVLQHRVGDRPNRYEPRARKRRPKKFPPLTEPRQKARARLAAAS
jgi:hypothetical protein